MPVSVVPPFQNSGGVKCPPLAIRFDSVGNQKKPQVSKTSPSPTGLLENLTGRRPTLPRDVSRFECQA